MTQYPNLSQEAEINLFVLANKFWRKRKSIYKACGIAIIIGLIIAFSIPKKYNVTVTLSPESGKTSGNGLSGMAATLGLGSFANGAESDALNIMLSPDILSSNPFALELYGMPVIPNKQEQTIPLNEYIKEQRSPWWSMIVGLPGKTIGGIIALFTDDKPANEALNPFQLTLEEAERLKSIKESIATSVDAKTGVTTITVTLQDPVVAATVADSVVTKLQNYITAYRTKKAIDDCVYWEKLYKERQQEYYTAQQKYAVYIDENKGLYTQKSKVESERLQNEMNLAYQVYNQMAQQLQLARGKIQEAKPVFAVVNPATVPLRAASPQKAMILIGCVFLAFIGAAAWILLGQDLWNELKKVNTENKETTNK